VVARHRDELNVYALTAHTNVERLIEQAAAFQPNYVVLTGQNAEQDVASQIKSVAPASELLIGADYLDKIVAEPSVDVVMSAIVGAAGLSSTMAAARAGKVILLANKESLVVAGELLMEAVNINNATLLPIDSEHNAIFQCLPADYADKGFTKSGIAKVLLTGSGGPFRTMPIEELAAVTPQQACNHPNWSMGRKISVDSATMMNKGLEFIEACHLFNLTADQLDVVIHPQSIVHSMVSYIDGSVIAQLGQPDMRTPIAYGLAWPNRIESGVEPLDFTQLSDLTFSAPDFKRYPCLSLAIDAFAAGGSSAAHLNAANEVAVAAFLSGAIKFTDIAIINNETLDSLDAQAAESIEQLVEQDQIARATASTIVQRRSAH
jgi:1-deoxy-D-xylulose-5-phosphate reductoisomerase